jgi:hypothetical protein
MTLNDLTFVRDKLALPPKTFAAVFGITTSSLSRWSTKGLNGEDIKCDPFRMQILTTLRLRMREVSESDLRALAVDVGAAFNRSGNLAALYRVLHFIYGSRNGA